MNDLTAILIVKRLDGESTLNDRKWDEFVQRSNRVTSKKTVSEHISEMTFVLALHNASHSLGQLIAAAVNGELPYEVLFVKVLAQSKFPSSDS